MTDDSLPISLEVQTEGGGTASSAEAVSIGLIVTELMTNAFKHAFVGNQAAGALVVAYQAAKTSWRLTVSDNRIGIPEGQYPNKPRPGLGTIIIEALAKQLDARVGVPEADAARRCRSLTERQIAPGFCTPTPKGRTCRQSGTATPLRPHDDQTPFVRGRLCPRQ